MSAAGLPEGASPVLHDLCRAVGKVLFRPAFRVRVRGRERVPRTGPVLLIANHSSMLEPQLIFGMLPRRSVFLVKEEMFTGAVGGFLRRIGQVPVRRGEPDRAPLLTTARILREGGLIGVFPEGTRGDGDVVSAEPGAAWLLRGTDAVVLPVAVRGTRRPPGAKRRFRPRVDVLVGEPFRVEVGKGRAGLAEATEKLRGELAALVRELDAQRAKTEKAKT
ncbi:1-acyl-sn-glycerol-3-phosphate acyltransferase [Amycolatopsis bartoniae]|uniref:1-acyl-sn-glycerol-3-phosphate acyltransferase n=1 Tax=Amycolatopsis bartoniae TaxID=941986 RepID=A0A8H9J0J6_9PSEU|nr:lysophospholipid acyltransferase family protein [Amycolatopsis bartoniae]MBB2936404.1 1-acyl-sn-glycerol-3-phosphate acyltransferase [Amycolatopsis bartoniae]TVT11104.1 1-acyl-sn-glycerol-3-phosphate acyltransferase [Amycolatopsis bartoniae]GHF69175.1 1-acyl-sn-glycerol-3-phosphate acyltransferase [Amycolatopsis bartoniae]